MMVVRGATGWRIVGARLPLVNGGAETELIEILDADPSVFGPSRMDKPPRVRQPRPRWTVPVALCVVAIMAVAVTLAVWKPWENQFRVRLAFPTAAVSEPTLSERLVFNDPPTLLTGSSLGTAGSNDSAIASSLGYFFAAPDASLNLGQGGTGRWAALLATGADGSAELGTGRAAVDVTVQGVPGVLVPAIGDQSLQLSFGPLDGRVYTVVTSEISQADTLAFAEVVSVDNDVPVIADVSVLRGLQPLCSVADFNTAYGIVLTASNPEYSQPQIVAAQYGEDSDRFTLTSQKAPSSGLLPLQFVLGGKIDATVHGQTALTLVTDDSEALQAFGVKLGSVVAWVEGGRLIMVTGRLSVDELLQLAETVRPATADEWNEISQARLNRATAR